MDNLVDLASELYQNYVDPGTANNFALIHQNNHRSKTGASLVMAAVALADYTPPPGSDPDGVREPTLWLEYGLDQVDLIVRHVLVTGDGAYAEGPFYWRFSAQNLLPFARAWDRLVDGADWPARGGITVPSPWRHPLFRRSYRWMLDMTFPDGALVPIDDGNPGRSFYFGAAPADPEDAAAFAWRWANAPTPFETDGNVDMAPDAIVHYDPDLVPAPPARSPTAFYPEGGNAILKSGWGADAVAVVVSAEYDTASEFGTDRAGLGVSPESHEHAEPGAFQMDAFGERLALDPGYIEFGERMRVNRPQHHNVILVDGQGPVDYLNASVVWGFDPTRRPPADGHARLTDTLDTGFADAARVTTSYGLGFFTPFHQAPRIERRFLFPDHRYLVVADRMETRDGRARTFTWLLHGNGGGSTAGAFAPLPDGGRWTRSAARLDAALAADTAPVVFREGVAEHEDPGKVVNTHAVLEADVTGSAVRTIGLVYPSPASAAAPTARALPLAGAAAVVLDHPDDDRRVLAWHRAAAGAPISVPAGTSGLADAASDGRLALFDAHADGSLRLAWAEDASSLAYAGVEHFPGAARGLLALAPGVDRAEVVADNGSERVAVAGLPFVPAAADGACALDPGGASAPPVVSLGRERRFVLRAASGNARPAADPGPDRRVLPGELVTLDGTASCDADGDTLTPRWELVSAPPRGAFRLTGADTWHPVLHADAAGPHRVRLVVRDAAGAESLPMDVEVTAGFPCADGLDDDLDGVIDGDDPTCAHALVEEARCSNGLDDDGDGLADGDDPECRDPAQGSETNPRCGLGFELAPLLWVLSGRRRART